ncbi:HAD hydrolase-like protein [Nisaea acidiphila]|uniref:HAD hydrolase-like protein n=1 Tax=Nisaea acidiphila TaxID=1862145 RepID=A0A9J7AR45_9PROT|nr:HAD hydrolase-like protein [Nisaea acidiphila]UUX50083.1 HAD hydrolase-like protein [Nisaea acidiphila]
MLDMEPLSFEEAWAGYLKWAHRLPPAPPPVEPRRISGIAEIIGDFDAVILDNFGVLSLGPPVIPAGPPAYAAIRDVGAKIRVISNDGSKTLSAMLESHRRRGYHFDDDEIYAGLSLLGDMARDTGDGIWAAIGLDPLPLPPGPLQARTWTAGGIEIDDAAGLLLMDCGEFRRQAFLPVIESFRERPRPVVVCNPDVTAPYSEEMSLEPGYLAHWLADETGIEPLFLGKPFPDIYRHALRDLAQILPERILCVGDTLHTDVLGGRNLGMKTLLVETGFTRGRDPLALAEECGIWPDFIASSI